jgi:hypothetical protein
MVILNILMPRKNVKKPFVEGRRFDLLNKEYLHDAHYNKLMNIPAISKKLKISSAHIRLKFKEFGIEIMPEVERKRLYLAYLKS